MLGAKIRMGVVRKQDEYITVNQLMPICKIPEKDWNESKLEEEKKEIEESVISFIVIRFCISLRGEILPLIVIEIMLAFWEESRAH